MAKKDSVSKDYILDTNVLLEDSNCIKTLNSIRKEKHSLNKWFKLEMFINV